MSSFLRLQSLANELNVLHREIQKLGKKISKVDIFKYELSNPYSVTSELNILKKDAASLITFVEKTALSGISKHTTFRERDTYAYGRYGQLKGVAESLILDLQILIRHIDFLLNSSAEGKKTVAMVVALSEMPDLDGDAKQADAVVGSILIIAGIIATLRRLF
jgi:hypothetical protein